MKQNAFLAIQRVLAESSLDNKVSAKSKEESTSNLCDEILCRLIDHDLFRDSVTDCAYNPRNNSLLLIINQDFVFIKELVDFIGKIEGVEGVKFESKDLEDTGLVKALKVIGNVKMGEPTIPTSYTTSAATSYNLVHP